MEDVVATLGLPQLTPLLVIVVFASVWVIQGIKRIVTMYVKGKWTQRIPPWSWWLLSVAVPVGIVYAFSIDWIQALLNASLPGDMSVTLPGYGEFATGVIASMSSNGVYAGLKKLGLTNDYKPGGPNDKSGPLDSQSENVVTQSGNVGQESQHISTSVGNFVPSGMGANGTTAGRPSGTGPDAGSIPAASIEEAESNACELGGGKSPELTATKTPRSAASTHEVIQGALVEPDDSPAYLLRFRSLPEGYVVLTPDGKLYRVHGAVDDKSDNAMPRLAT